MENEILLVAESVSGEKDLPKESIFEAIEQALAIRAINQVIVSTDDASIAKIAEQFGAEVPFLRPKN